MARSKKNRQAGQAQGGPIGPSMRPNSHRGSNNNYAPPPSGDFSYRAQHAPQRSFYPPPPSLLPPGAQHLPDRLPPPPGLSNGQYRNPPAQNQTQVSKKRNNKNKNNRAANKSSMEHYHQPMPNYPPKNTRPPKQMSDRPILFATRNRSPTPEQLPGMGNGEIRFKPVNEQQIQDSNSGSTRKDEKQSEPAIKKQKVQGGGEKPKWSNPDPYIAKLPVQSTPSDRADNMLAMIREAASGAATKAGQRKQPPATSKPAEDFLAFEADPADSRGTKRRALCDPSQFKSSLGRILDSVREDWDNDGSTDATPWLDSPTATHPNFFKALDGEIWQFWTFMRPQVFEDDVRYDLIDRVQTLMDNIRFPYGHSRPCEVRAFGSFTSGMYLPNADMDLVVMTQEYIDSGTETVRNKNLWQLQSHLLNRGLAKPGSVAVITRAKVPLIKYVDDLTGLRVDISFENDSGLIANDTYDAWDEQYEPLAPLVVLIKQLLLMRNLNEVHTGGIGGFAITCTVVAFLATQGPFNNNECNDLGELFMGYLNFYSNFDLEGTAIEMNPPRLIPKTPELLTRLNTKGGMDKFRKLTIIDPNRSNNDISGGTRNIDQILGVFRDAYVVLSGVQDIYHPGSKDSRCKNILQPLFGGDFTPYFRQREILEQVHRTSVAKGSA